MIIRYMRGVLRTRMLAPEKVRDLTDAEVLDTFLALLAPGVVPYQEWLAAVSAPAETDRIPEHSESDLNALAADPALKGIVNVSR
jgi:hypothetical protein